MFEPSFCSVLTSILLFKLKGEIRAYGNLKLKYIFYVKKKRMQWTEDLNPMWVIYFLFKCVTAPPPPTWILP